MINSPHWYGEFPLVNGNILLYKTVRRMSRTGPGVRRHC